MADAPVLEVDDLGVAFNTPGGPIQVVRGVSFSLRAGETLALLGESGSGKSITGKAVMGLLPSGARLTTGKVLFQGRDLTRSSSQEWRRTRGSGMAMVFQDPLSALNPSRRVGDQITEGLRRRLGVSRRACRAIAADLLEKVGIADPQRRLDDYPHQFSGGMRQRVIIAMAVAMKPKLIIADEPTTALDVTVQAQIMQLLQALQRQSGMALILITHDLGSAAQAAGTAAVMYAGRLVEFGPLRQVYENPCHPYTRALLASVPRCDRRMERMVTIAGVAPDFSLLPQGCSYRPRCPLAAAVCLDPPPLKPVCAAPHCAACHFAGEKVR